MGIFKMFTGIIEAQGTVKAFKSGKLEIVVPQFFGKLKRGSSLAVDGVCLTVTRQTARIAVFDVVRETQKRSTLGLLAAGSQVNLERPLKWQGRIEGHFVSGHVDGVGIVKVVTKRKNETDIQIQASPNLKAFLVEKGSVAINGASLTLGKVKGGIFWIHCIPHTLKLTNLNRLQKGDRVNLEADLAAKLICAKRSRRFN